VASASCNNVTSGSRGRLSWRAAGGRYSVADPPCTRACTRPMMELPRRAWRGRSGPGSHRTCSPSLAIAAAAPRTAPTGPPSGSRPRPGPRQPGKLPQHQRGPAGRQVVRWHQQNLPHVRTGGIRSPAPNSRCAVTSRLTLAESGTPRPRQPPFGNCQTVAGHWFLCAGGLDRERPGSIRPPLGLDWSLVGLVGPWLSIEPGRGLRRGVAAGPRPSRSTLV
jgi:hypothetical protein